MNLGGSAFSLNPDGSLLIISPSGNETGEFICTAANAAGHVSRKVQLTVYGKSHHQLKAACSLYRNTEAECSISLQQIITELFFV